MSIIGWLVKIFAAIIIMVFASLLIGFVGGFLVTIGQTQITYFGNFLVKSASLLGFLIAGSWLIWGDFPEAKFPRRG